MKLATGFLALTVSLSIGCVTDTADTQEDAQSLLGDSMGFMVDMATGTPVPDSEWRIDQGSWGVFHQIDTTGESLDVYTTWLCGFNEPSECLGVQDATDMPLTASCSAADMFGRNLGGPFCQWGAGSIALPDGRTILAGGAASNPDTHWDLPGQVLTDPAGAELFLAIRTHGDIQQENLIEQLTTYNGGCPGGVGPCMDVQIGVPYPPAP